MSGGSICQLQTLQLGEIAEGYRSLRLVTPRAEKQMVESLERYGQMSPVVVCRSANEQYELLDGFKRLDASGRLGWERLQVRELSVGQRAAKAAVLCLNWVSSSVSALEEGWVVHALVRQDGLTQQEVAQLLGRAGSWVSRRLSLAERLGDEVQSQLRLGLISGTVGRELARLPCGKQEQMLETVTAHNLGSRELDGLVTLYNEAPPEERRQLLQSPREALAAQGKDMAPADDSRLTQAGNRLLRNLSRMERACARISATVGIEGLSHLSSGDLPVLAPAFGQARRAALEAGKKLRVALIATERKDNDDVQQS